MKYNKFLIRVLGNLGISFFGPLTGATVANSIYNINITFEQQLSIAAVSSIFVTGLVLAREAERYGRRK